LTLRNNDASVSFNEDLNLRYTVREGDFLGKSHCLSGVVEKELARNHSDLLVYVMSIYEGLWECHGCKIEDSSPTELLQGRAVEKSQSYECVQSSIAFNSLKPRRMPMLHRFRADEVTLS
jgi:hypothetical protein